MSAILSEVCPDVACAPSVEDRAIRVLLADIAGTARDALAALLDTIHGVELVEQVGTRQDVTDAMRRREPDVLLIDDRLIEGGGFVDPFAVRMIVMGVDDDPAYAARASRLGAEAWIAKDQAAEDLPRLLEAA
jgi:DNA-binding NarL/FixJ family response regulator